MAKKSHLLKQSWSKRIIASFLSIVMLESVLLPTVSYALTSGPAQPEYTSFEPSTSTSMVNEFTGDFSYNLPVLQVPGPNGGGYSMSLSYHAGASPEEEASWVGYGWTLNPGAINRQVQGIPDDWNGVQVTSHSKAPAAVTIAGGADVGAEAFANNLGVGANALIRYSNYSGYGYGVGGGLTLAQGVVSVGYNLDNGSGSFSLSVNPASRLLGSIGRVMDGMANYYGMNALVATTYPMSAGSMQGIAFTSSITTIPTPSQLEIGVQIGVFGRASRQKTNPISTNGAYGTLYTAGADSSDLMDYHTEKPNTYNKRDKFLPPSFADPDIFGVSGEGIGGSMSIFPKKAKNFRPDTKTSTTTLMSVGTEFQGGFSVGPGVTVTGGYQSLTMEGWDHESNNDPIDEPYFFRMSNDPGGFVLYGTTTDPERAYIHELSGLVPGNKIAVRNGSNFELDGRSGRSTYVGWSKASEVKPAGSNYNTIGKAKAYERADLSANSLFSRNDLDDDAIAEFSVSDPNGKRYNYGLPLNARNEANLSYSAQDAGGLDATNYARATANSIANCKFKSGTTTEPNAAYASQYLLTSVTDADYIDRNLDGPTLDDLGGYTKFTYKREYGANNAWYKWRMPYNGYAYSRGEISECYDDKLMVSSGEREVYYLDEVRTKTHVAKFILNDVPREDGLGAQSDPIAGYDLGQKDESQKLRYLKRIDLYTLSAYEAGGQTPLRSVMFDYNYECWPGVTNNANMGSSDQGTGKLTLKKVWFESNGVIEAKIAPYEFDYKYPTTNPFPVQTPNPPDAYEIIGEELTETGAGPHYDINGNGPWGEYAANGYDRAMAETPWLDQSPPSSYDPAAWQLKKIKMPSGGEIYVQYEQDSYTHVQADRAHTMVANIGIVDNYFKVPCPECGSDPQDIERWATLIRNEYVDTDKKMFFKMRYKMRDDPSQNPWQNTWRNWENITGYVRITNAIADGSEVKVYFGTGPHQQPKDICRDLFNAEKRGKQYDSDCTADLFKGPIPTLDVTDGGAAISAIGSLISEILSGGSQNELYVTSCSVIEPQHSYVRLPVLKKKLGGGLRVKRIVMHAPQAFTAGGQRILSGSEYCYEAYDTTVKDLVSTGVATNEPMAMREENILVRTLDRYNQTWFDRVIGGRDKKNTEGPIGESVYPAPSVGYARVVIKNISENLLESSDPESCVAAPGFAVYEFNTAADYPIITDDPTDLASFGSSKRDQLFLPAVFYNRITDRNWLSQGFTIRFNEMHGQLKSSATYGGLATRFIGKRNTPPLLTSIGTRTSYEYYSPGSNIPVWNGPRGTMDHLPLGQEMMVATEDRAIKDKMDDRPVEIDVTIGFFGLIPVIMAGLGISNTVVKTEIHTHTTTKVIRYPAILKKVVAEEKGIFHVTQNLGFDRNTGQPLVVRTHDGFLQNVANTASGLDLSSIDNAMVTTYNVPAALSYPDMGQKARGEKKVLPNDSGNLTMSYNATEHKIEFSSNSSPTALCDALGAMCAGDLLSITSGGSTVICTSTGVDGSDVGIVPAAQFSNTYPVQGNISKLQILKSGCTNQLFESSGGYTTYGQPLATVATGPRQQFVDALNACLNAGVFPCNVPTPLETEHQVQYQGTPIEVISIVTIPNSQNAIIVDIGRCKLALTDVVAFTLTNDGYLAMDLVNGCASLKVDCFQFADPWQPEVLIDQVIASSATTYSDNWTYNEALYDPAAQYTTHNAYEKGARGKWRPAGSFDFLSSTVTNDKNFGSGWYSMPVYNWELPSMNDPMRWIKNSSITKYSPNGETIEQENAIGTVSTIKYGYGMALPYLTADNCRTEHAHFESFEYSASPNKLENGLPLLSTGVLFYGTAHSGKRSYRVINPTLNDLLFQSKPMPVDQQLVNEGLMIKTWVRVDKKNGTCVPPTDLYATLNGVNTPLNAIARNGEWTLFQSIVPVPNISSDIQCGIICGMGAGNDIYIDDVAMHPADATFSAQVYDAGKLRLMTSFDDRHFGLYYKYDTKGDLTSKQIETERGFMTISDSYSNTPKRTSRP